MGLITGLAKGLATGGGVLLRGLRARAVLTAGCLALACLAVAAGVLGPTYLASATSSLAAARADEQPPWVTGLSWRFDPEGSTAARPDAAVAAAVAAADSAAPSLFGAPQPSLATLPLGTDPVFTLRNVPGQCDHVVVDGRCPASAGEAMVSAADRVLGGFRVGSTISVPLNSVHYNAGSLRLEVVGVYRLDEPDSDYWYQAERYRAAAKQNGRVPQPYRPAALLVSEAEFARLTPAAWYVQLDRPLRTDGATVQTLSEAVAAASASTRRGAVEVDGGRLTSEDDNQLGAVRAEAVAEQNTAQDTILPAAASLVVVAVLLLHGVLVAATERRRPEIALRKLRGGHGWALWRHGLAEAVVVLVIALPVGVGVGLLVASRLAGAWLQPGTPVGLTRGAVLAALGVVLAGLLAAAWAVRGVVREPLAAQLEPVRRPPRPSTGAAVGRAGVVAAGAVSYLGVALATPGRPPSVLDLVMPLALASAVALAAGTLLRRLARSRSRLRRGRVGPFLTVRRLSRRADGTAWVLPLAVAVSVLVFSIGTWAAAAAWRESVAATEVGAPVAYPVAGSLDQVLALTRRLDPEGRWLMAAARYPAPVDRVYVDSTRLASVAEWPDSWTPGLDAGDVAELLAPEGDPLVLRGRELSAELDNQLAGGAEPTLVFVLRTPRGEVRQAFLGPYATGIGTHRDRVRGCVRGCELVAVEVALLGGLPMEGSGTVGVRALAVDGAAVDAGLTEADRWRPAYRRGVEDSARTTVRATADGLQVDVETDGSAAVAAVTTADVPLDRPVVVARETVLPAAADWLDPLTGDGAVLVPGVEGDPLPARVVATAESLPLVGTDGVLGDMSAFSREDTGSATEAQLLVLAADDVPPEIVEQLTGAAGQSAGTTTLAQVRHRLDTDAYALGLRLYLVSAVAVVLLGMLGALAGVAVSARERRRESAALRVLGVRMWTVTSATLRELAWVFGVAGAAGLLSGVLAEQAVVRAVTLATVDETLPRVPTSLDTVLVLSVSGAVVALTVVLASAASWLLVRRVRPADLREGVG